MVVISFAQGIIHPYYSVALAPAIGALVGIGASTLWAERHQPWARIALAVALAATSVWAFALLDRAPQWLPWLRTTVLAVGLAAALLVAVPAKRGWPALVLAVVAVGVGCRRPRRLRPRHGGHAAQRRHPVGWSGLVDRPRRAPWTGPTGRLRPRGPGDGGTPRRRREPGHRWHDRWRLPGGTGRRRRRCRHRRAGRVHSPGAGLGTGGTGTATGGLGGLGGSRYRDVSEWLPRGTRGGGGGPGGGFLSASTPGKAVVQALESDATHYTWVAATVNSNSAAGYQLATDDPVMAIGGFNGTDPAPTLAQFEKYVAEKKIHYFIAGGGGLGTGGTGTTAGEITSWVESHFTAQTVSGVTLYDLTSAR